MTIETTTRIWREGKHFIAHAMPLDVSSAGDTADDAKRAIQEAVELFITTAKAHGTLEELLEECGYTRHD
jgi:predicted RNase H-like HicB family nuclease